MGSKNQLFSVYFNMEISKHIGYFGIIFSISVLLALTVVVLFLSFTTLQLLRNWIYLFFFIFLETIFLISEHVPATAIWLPLCDWPDMIIALHCLKLCL